jgi:hypothetical protein
MSVLKREFQASEPYELVEVIDAGEQVLFCQRAPMHGRGSALREDIERPDDQKASTGTMVLSGSR